MLDIFCSEFEEKRNKLKTYLESSGFLYRHSIIKKMGNDSNLLIVFYVQIMPDDFVMQLHRF